ncbi:type II toxin-antitoxin system HicB family antitoxin [Candidatus Kuenenbacteria bacterium]|nr:type II toxin-antitoxin system HicB family antitoxin [Candidatus Kuenenbacteria bacterium]
MRVIIEKDEDGIYIASVPSLSGCHTQAKTYEKVVERIQQAAGLYLEVMRDKDQLKHLLAKREPSFLAVEDLAIRI